jgi:hypothetical protein
VVEAAGSRDAIARSFANEIESGGVVVSGALLAIWWIGAIGTCSYYWFTQGREEEFLVGRTKGFLSFFFWPLFLVYLVAAGSQATGRRG